MSDLAIRLREDLMGTWPHLHWHSKQARKATGSARGWIVRIALDHRGYASGTAVLLPVQACINLSTAEAMDAWTRAMKNEKTISVTELRATLAELAAGLEIACAEAERVTLEELTTAIRDVASLMRQISTEVHE